MTRLGLGLLGGNEVVVGEGQVWCGGAGGTVIWMMVMMLLDLGLPREDMVVVEGCLVSRREEEEAVMTVRRMMMMMPLGLGVPTECSIEVAGKGEGQRVLNHIKAGTGVIWVCRGGEGGIVIWMIMTMIMTLDLDPREEDMVVVEGCLVCRREEGGKVIWMTTMTMMMWLALVILVLGK